MKAKTPIELTVNIFFSGQRFAYLEMKAVIGRILCNFYLEPMLITSELLFKTSIMMHPTTHSKVKFVRINEA